MICPVCESKQSSDQSFCRECGASLGADTKPLARPSAMSVGRDTSDTSMSRERIRIPPFWGLLITFVGVAISVVGKMVLHADIITAVGVLIALAGMLLAAYPFLSVPRPPKPITAKTDREAVLTPSQPTRKLPDISEASFIPSVVEDTTDLLPVSDKRKHN